MVQRLRDFILFGLGMVELKLLLAIAGFLVGLVGLFGWSHKTLRMRMDDLETTLKDKTSEDKVRLLIRDKMEVVHSDMNHLANEIREIKQSQDNLNMKLDAVLNIVAKLQVYNEQHKK